MAKYYKMVITSTYSKEVIVKANSIEEANKAEDGIINKVNLLDDDDPQIIVRTYERDDYDDDDVDFDLTKTEVSH